MNYQYRVLPCPNFSIGEPHIIQKYGFLSFPQFVDNGWKTNQGIEWNKAVQKAKLFHPIFFIANDDEPLKDLEKIKKYAAKIILPLHLKEDLDNYYDYFDWIGYPNDQKARDFSLDWFLRNTEGKFRWWLGLHDYPEDNPGKILEFNGLDSTLPELYAGKYGKIWETWRTYRKPPNRMHWRPIFEQNIQNFRLFLDHLKPINQTRLTQFGMLSNEA